MHHIWSVTERRQLVGAVDFVCPRCGLDRIGHEVVVRRWRAVFRVPLVPFGDGESAVSCTDCAHQCDLGVLEIPTTAQLAVLLERATVSAAVILVWASSDDEVPDVLRRSVAMLAAEGYGYDEARLVGVVAVGSRSGENDSVRRLRHELTPSGKQGFLHRMAALVSTGGGPNAAHRVALVDIGRSLGLTVSEVRDLLATSGERADI